MIRFCEQLIELRRSLSPEELEGDWVQTLAIMRLLETLGEAAGKVSVETRTSHPEIPRAAIKAMRNRLIHGYDDVEYDLVWLALRYDVPELLVQLRLLFTGLKDA